MLRAKLLDDYKYYIFLDRKPTRDRNRARALHNFLDSYLLLHKNNCGIEHLQSYDSIHNILIQITDFFTGLIAYVNNEDIVNDCTKSRLCAYFKSKTNQDLTVSSPLREEKVNIFVWEAKI